MSQRRTAPRRLPEGGGLNPDRLSQESEVSSSNAPQFRQCLACILATLTMGMVGIVHGWRRTSLVLLTTGSRDVPLTLTRYEYSWSVTLTILGSMIGSLLAAQLADRIGRKKCLLVCCTMFTVGWLITYDTTYVPMLYLAQGILGIGVGIAHTINPMFVSEVADIKLRGRLGTLIAANVYSGSLVTYALAMCLTYKLQLMLLVTISFILLLSIAYFPESPYFLVAKGQMEEACKSIAYYKAIEDPRRVMIELRALRAQVRYELHQESRSDLHSQSRSDLPSQSRNDLPSQSRSNLPSQSIRETHSDPIREVDTEATSDVHRSSTCEMHGPSTSQIHRPSTSQIHRPSTSQIHPDAACDMQRPSTSGVHRPSTSQIHRPSTSQIHPDPACEMHRPSTSEVHRPSTSEVHRPSTSQIHRPSTSQIHPDPACDMQRPSTSGVHRPSTSQIHRPSTSQIHPDPACDMQRPSTSGVHRPSTSQIHRPSTSQIHPDPACEMHRPSTSGVHRPSTSQIHRPSTSQILPRTRCELHSRPRRDLRTESSVDSRASTDIPEPHMDETKYTCSTKLRALLQRSNMKALFIMLGLIMAQQLSGNFIITHYLEVLISRKASFIDLYDAMILVQLVRILSGYLTTLIVEWYGRRALLILSTLGSFYTLFILAGYLSLSEHKFDVSIISFLPFIDLILYHVAFQIGLGTLPNVLLCELFPTKLKGFVGAIVVIFDGIIGFAATQLYQMIAHNMGSYLIYITFATLCWMAFLMVYIWVPETKGKTYQEIEALLGGENLNSLNEEVRTDEMEMHRI